MSTAAVLYGTYPPDCLRGLLTAFRTSDYHRFVKCSSQKRGLYAMVMFICLSPLCPPTPVFRMFSLREECPSDKFLLTVGAYSWRPYTHRTCLYSLLQSSIITPNHRERDNKRCFCLSVTYIANNSRTQRPSVPKFGRKEGSWPFKVKWSKVRVGGGRAHTMLAEPGIHTACCSAIISIFILC